MSDIVIKAENIGKLYKLGEIGTGTISHDLNRWWARVRGKEDPFAKIGQMNDRTTKGSNDWVWALKDIDFEVKRGEVIGIIGRNGAGKSTLLKILSKVTTPSTGRIKLKGRIASLLEVGTGFHPELTGRENIYLNGAILGMTKSEIRSKFDEIVDFAGVERYIDTPVKRYSSGMYVRLAFAVAAFLEPEILIVDEVLAVGDAEFQKKCLGRMKDVSVNDGRTVLFVSHNMGAISNLCNKSILLRNGTLHSYGLTNKVLEEYISFGTQTSGEVSEPDIAYKRKCSKAYFNSIKILNGGKVTANVDISKELLIELVYTIAEDNSVVYPSVHLLDNMGTCILASFNGNSATINHDPFFGKSLMRGQYRSVAILPANFLNESSYSISAFLVPENFDDLTIVENALNFTVIDTGEMRKEFNGEWAGLIRPKLTWTTEIINK